jgi:peptidoglycan/xylan/chitin deacetylase (PgdA/CDA1 family)
VLVDPPTPAAPASPPPVRLPDRAVDRLAEPETAPPLPGPVRPRAKAASLSRGNPTLPQVVLSFDGGSGANSALPILDALDAAGIRTTFFLTGEFVRSHPDVTRQIAERGHEVGNHTDDHPHLTLWNETRRHTTRPEIDAEALRRELTAADASFRMVTGRPMAPLWRAPYGEINSEILGWAADLGYRHVGWTTGFDSLDWVADPASSRYRTPEEFVDLIASRATSGSGRLNGVIILMHLNSWRPEGERFGAHLGSLVRVLRAAGYELVTAGTLLRNLQPSGEATSSR